jgi:geranylgeranyl pyrophosphate synthase
LKEASSALRPAAALDLDFFEEERARLEKALAQIVAREGESLPSGVRDPVEYALSTTGKRFRPVLFLLAYSAARDGAPIPEAAYRLACALEIVHTYSLVHDDLPCMDDDDLRRGRPTVHRVFGISGAVVGGAALLPIAVAAIEKDGAELGLDVATRARMVIELARASGAEGMVGGQLLDLEAEQRELSALELEDIHRKKTGALVTSALRLGAIAGGASVSLLDTLTLYGESIGLAFQIADDILDVEGDAVTLGKAVGKDAAAGKATFVSHLGLDGAKSRAADLVQDACDALSVYGDVAETLKDAARFVISRTH